MTHLPATVDRRSLAASPTKLLFMCSFAALLVYCSFIFEVHAITVLLQDFGATRLVPGLSFTLAEGVAAGLNGAKIALSIIIADLIVSRQGWTLVPRLLRLLVFTLSLTLTLVIFAVTTISPNARATYDARLTAIKDQYAASLSDLDETLDDRATLTVDTYTTARSNESTTAQARIDELQTLLDAERQVGGQDFRGTRYTDLETKLAEANTGLANRLDALRAEEQAALDGITAERAEGHAALIATRDTARAGVDLAAIAADPEAQHPAIVAFAKIVETVFQRTGISPILVTVGLSLLMTLALELLPMAILTYAFKSAGLARLAQAEAALEARDSQTVTRPVPNAVPQPTTAPDQTAPDQTATGIFRARRSLQVPHDLDRDAA